MPKYEYVGRPGRFLGKSLPQICLKLKNFGIGRMFVRETFKRYPRKTLFPIYIFYFQSKLSIYNKKSDDLNRGDLLYIDKDGGQHE
jgi:hypothetical protein